MKLAHDHSRLSLLVVAIALLGGLAVWRLSETAQAHRAHPDLGVRLLTRTVERARMERRHAFGTGSLRIQPGGSMLGAACFVTKAGVDGGPVRIVPLDSPRPVLRYCSDYRCVEPFAGSARAPEVYGGGYRELLPAWPLRPLARCAAGVPPPG